MTGMILTLSGPSGVGKTSIAEELIRILPHPAAHLAISVTTRQPRPGESDGLDFHFVRRPRFEAMVAAGHFLEHTEIHGNRYGTPKAPVENALAAGRDVILVLDWEGVRQIRAQRRDQLVSIFILPERTLTLYQRLIDRGDHPESAHNRMKAANAEIENWMEYDYRMTDTATVGVTAGLIKHWLETERRIRRRDT